MQAINRKRLGRFLLALATLGALWGFTQQLPFVILEPGPVVNVLGTDAGQRIIQVDANVSDDSIGSLDLLTVSELGNPDQTPNLFELASAFFSTDKMIYPLSALYPDGSSTKDVKRKSTAQFTSSESVAIAVAKAKVGDSANAANVSLRLGDIGGPSGGLMFTLGVIDKLTPGSLTGGKLIAGTGTIEPSGAVGRIGGIRLKALGAERNGDRYLLIPKGNCAELGDSGGFKLRVVPVSNIGDALAALEIIAGDQGDTKLPVCPSR